MDNLKIFIFRHPGGFADKSIFELHKTVDAIDKVIKSLINENL